MIRSHPRLVVVVSWGAVNGNMIQRFSCSGCAKVSDGIGLRRFFGGGPQ
jgi:hypothetical protein